ncbi:MAG: hypothetical protein F6J87_14855 [Spirulina sp. SIO3F2]|nr:hypothetical protein [Spirulina sp. SIO3F2]
MKLTRQEKQEYERLLKQITPKIKFRGGQMEVRLGKQRQIMLISRRSKSSRTGSIF